MNRSSKVGAYGLLLLEIKAANALGTGITFQFDPYLTAGGQWIGNFGMRMPILLGRIFNRRKSFDGTAGVLGSNPKANGRNLCCPAGDIHVDRCFASRLYFIFV